MNLFRHLHEVQSGRTSSISLDFLGFDSTGKVLNYAEHTIEQICDQSTKLVTLIDLAGHQKYMKTTCFGLTGYHPHCIMLCVAANMGKPEKDIKRFFRYHWHDEGASGSGAGLGTARLRRDHEGGRGAEGAD